MDHNFIQDIHRDHISNNWYVISDTHFNHSNIIKYCNRPYKDVDEMNIDIINKWNSIITNDDVVIHLGDIGFGKDDVVELVKQLNGYIILIKGNHDRTKLCSKLLKDKAIDELYNDSYVWFNDSIILSHKPVQESMLINNIINIHGHLHNTGNYQDIKDTSKYINVSIEMIDYKPQLINNYKN